jgi:hypothetical protein
MVPALPLAASLALGAAVSTSDLGLVIAGNGGATPQLVSACPASVKVFAAGFGAANATAASLLRSYRLQCTGGDTIVELPAALRAPLLFDPALEGAQHADEYWGFVNGPTTLLGAFVAGDVDWLQAPASLFAIASPAASALHRDYARAFLARLATHVNLLAIARGETFSMLLPPLETVTGAQEFCAVFQGALAALPSVGWSWHGLSAALAQDPTLEAATTFGYRTVSDGCSIGGSPLFVELSAAGGWLGGARTADQVMGWLRFVDDAVDGDAPADRGVRGVLLRSVGDGSPDDLSPLAPQLATHLARPPPPGGNPPVDPGTGVGPGTPGAGGGGPVGGVRHDGGCGHPASALALLGLVPLALRRARVSRRR